MLPENFHMSGNNSHIMFLLYVFFINLYYKYGVCVSTNNISLCKLHLCPVFHNKNDKGGKYYGKINKNKKHRLMR